jgi:hypothetical protein
MRFTSRTKRNPGVPSAVCFTLAVLAILLARSSSAQSVPYQRTFPQSKAVVEKDLKELQSSSAGRLPTLEGFTAVGDRPLDQFHRGYYQCSAQVIAAPSGGSIVRVNATISAWYTDPISGKAGYQTLPSNGRLEADFLDRLQDVLNNHGSSANTALGTTASNPPASAARSQPNPPQANPSTPQLSAPGVGSKTPVGSPFKLGSSLSLDNMSSLATQKAVIDRHAEEQAKEVKGLEDILRNQAHPANLVAVRKKETPVLANPIEDAKVLFLASAEDEFEILDSNPNWVHVRISGISRGWIRRSSLEMPPADPDPPPAQTQERSEPSHPDNPQPFHVENEQVASFPGNWVPLMGKTVRIVTVQKAIDDSGVTGPEAKLAYAKSLFDREYSDLIRTSSSVAGVVVIFDSDDGGMIAATMPALGQWKSATLSDQAFWRHCFFDPREAFGLAENP